MVNAWYIDNETTDADKQQPHHKNPEEYVTMDELYRRTGVEYFPINLETVNTDGKLDKIRSERGYVHTRPLLVSREHLKDEFDSSLRRFYREHLHEEEILLLEEGSGYFDVRDINDKWIRICAVPGDMIIFPVGVYHRATLTTDCYMKALSFSTDKPVLEAIVRPADDHPCRAVYLENIKNIRSNAGLAMPA